MVAECMYRFAITAQVLTKDAPFITFGTIQVMHQSHSYFYGHIFGVKRGAFTEVPRKRDAQRFVRAS